MNLTTSSRPRDLPFSVLLTDGKQNAHEVSTPSRSGGRASPAHRERPPAAPGLPTQLPLMRHLRYMMSAASAREETPSTVLA